MEKLTKTVQCQGCPWKKNTNPCTDIPNGYSIKKHKELRKTIAPAIDYQDSDKLQQALFPKALRIFTCHEASEAPCLGWLVNQLTSGNNIPLRIKFMNCKNLNQVKLVGEQHKNFDDTLPKDDFIN